MDDTRPPWSAPAERGDNSPLAVGPTRGRARQSDVALRLPSQTHGRQVANCRTSHALTSNTEALWHGGRMAVKGDMHMRDASEQPNTDPSGPSTELPLWSDCDAFCINSYSGAGGPACGWRGKFEEARHDAIEMRLHCPRCGCPTLLRIPLDRSDEAGA